MKLFPEFIQQMTCSCTACDPAVEPLEVIMQFYAVIISHEEGEESFDFFFLIFFVEVFRSIFSVRRNQVSQRDFPFSWCFGELCSVRGDSRAR